MAVSRSTGCHKQEGWRIKRQFDATYTGLHGWWDNQHNFARKHKYVLTAFGRFYPQPDIDNPDGGWRSKAERNSVNGPIQGTAADLCKIAMTLVYKAVKKRDWFDKVLMTITMHDELVFEIDGDILEDAIEVISNIMCRNAIVLAQKWPIPFTCDVEIGRDWTVPYDLNEMKWGEVRFDGDTEYTEKDRDAVPSKLPPGQVWDDMPNFPSALAPLFNNKGPGGVGVNDGYNDSPLPQEGPPEGGSPPPSNESGGAPPPAADPTPAPTQAAVAADSTPTVSQPAVPRLAPGETYEFRLAASLSLETINRLARILRKCRGRGSQILRLVSAEGESLDDWVQVGNGGQPLRIHAGTFYTLAHDAGLC